VAKVGGTKFLEPQNRHLAFVGSKVTTFLQELWSMAAGTLSRGLESWDVVGDQCRRASQLPWIRITDVFKVYLLIFWPNITTIGI